MELSGSITDASFCDTEKLRKLSKTACDALFDLHDYMWRNPFEPGDERWRQVYGYRCDVGRFIDSVIRIEERAKQFD
jgi:hypothetical protein